VQLPEELMAAIQREAGRADASAVVRASHELTRSYKAGTYSRPPIQSAAHRAAYLTVRLPATYAANWRVLSEIRRLAPLVEIRTLLDLGAGPGTTVFAAAEIFPGLRKATELESSEAWLKLGQQIAGESRHAVVREAQWGRQDLQSTFACPPHDLVVISYALGELAVEAAEALLRHAWSHAKEFLVVIEPGTPRGFSVVHGARSAMIAAGAHILAPCPHANACPMAGTHDWCHFAQRVERTSRHRRLKAATLGYEDEKFSYLVASRNSYAPVEMRIVRHPQKRSGHVQLSLCGRQGLETQTITRSDKESYKQARQAQWGDAWGGVSAERCK
jgi:ribosomal protein RSM22 (predicted rRNA methylase)